MGGRGGAPFWTALLWPWTALLCLLLCVPAALVMRLRTASCCVLCAGEGGVHGIGFVRGTDSSLAPVPAGTVSHELMV